MSKAYIRSLMLKSLFIQREIDSELKRPLPDSLRLLRLKKLRLKIRDKISLIMMRPSLKPLAQ